MSAGARADRSLDDPEFTEAETPAPGEKPRIQCWTETATGIHAVPLEQALKMFRDCQAASSPDDVAVPVVWIDVAHPGPEEATFLRETLGFHPLAVEDCVRGRQRPKLDRYPGYYFLVMYGAGIHPQKERMVLHEVHVFLGRRYIVTVHDHRIHQLTEALARWRAAPQAFRTVGAIAHAILDGIVDGYFPVLDHFSERVEAAEQSVFHLKRGQAGTEGMERLLALRREMTLFRKVLGPERELMASLLRRDLPFLSPELTLYFQDVYDHSVRAVEEIDTLRDLLSVAMEGQLAVASQQLNETMRVMAAWSIILMAMALVAGIYGMNFRLMPETQWRYGYAWAIVLMAALGLTLLGYFRRRRWV